ncbi:zinc-binding dehydrogenase [Kineosporia sp. NBRC 101731]|nr:zinc-binding dehydrogenase [Kineosporia sp. NBRC 101731]GLY31912.1 zinc-binding dehydrogenase [Kineosporia sp. NBRC 101731]
MITAWQFTNTHEPLRRVELDDPIAAAGGVVVDVKASGICHSDVGMLEDEGWLKILAKRPITMGHEVAGVISAVGAGVTEWKIGDRVGLCPTTSAGTPGYTFDGGYADKVAIGQEALVRIPDGVSFTDGAYATDAGMTSHHAVVALGGATTGMKVGIIGLGGLGQIGARAAVLNGASVVAAEPNEKVWEIGRSLGVGDIRKDISDFDGDDLDLIVDFAGFGSTTAGAIDVVRPGGTVVLVGMGRLTSEINTYNLIVNRIRLLGSAGGDPSDIAKIYGYMADGSLTTTTTTVSFDEIPDGLGRLARGEVVGRLVASFGD